MPSVTIHLTGYLAQLAGRKTYAIQAGSVRDALESLQQFPKLNPVLTSKRYVIKVDECPTADQLDAALSVPELHFRPQPESATGLRGGSGDTGSFIRIVIGAVLVVVGLWVSTMSFGLAAPLGQAITSVGIGLMLGGVYSLLFPVDEPDTSSEQSSSFDYANTTKSGTPIPIILGRHKWGGHMIGFNVDSVDKGASSRSVFRVPGWTRVEIEKND